MTTFTTIMKKYDPHFVGFEPLFDQFRRFEMKSDESSGGYPPYNIIKNKRKSFSDRIGNCWFFGKGYQNFA